MYEYTLSAAAVTGGLRWPIGAPGYKEGPSLTVRPAQATNGQTYPYAPFTDKPTLREMVESLLMSEGGDFSTAPLLAEPMLTIRRIGRTHTTVRTFDLAKAATIQDYIDHEWSGFPMYGDE